MVQSELISVIMSTYNESEEELETSICSILGQSYSNIEFIIVNDNPENSQLKNILLSIRDSRVRIIENPKNMGLVNSLNRAWKLAKGNIIARMDADDVSKPNRLEDQLRVMQKEKFDLLGCNMEMIDDQGNSIYPVRHYPTTEKKIKKNIYWCNCIAHPTWMLKKSLYWKLGGYRNIPYCEDYDFILRVIRLGYKVGNSPNIGFIYKKRNNGISGSNGVDQYLIKRYLANNRKRILELSENELQMYCTAQIFEDKKKRYVSYCENKQHIKNKEYRLMNCIQLLINPYLYIYVINRLVEKRL